MSEVAGNSRVIAGRYRLLSRLGEGGMGVVWRAMDEVLHREVAVKEVRAPASLGGTDGQHLYARLEREAWAAARISHRNVVTVYDVATEDGRPWIVMELIRGLALSDELAAVGPLPPERAAHIGAEVLAALRGAHQAGVLHRDVKPGNVLLADDGRVVLTDFGIASVEGTSPLTMTGELIGSPEYLAPERAMGRTPGPESDLWSLGVLLYAAVENNSPFRQPTPLSTMRAVVDEELPPPRRAGALTPVIEGLLRKNPAERLSAPEAEAHLRAVAAGRAVAPPPTVTAPGTPYTQQPVGTPPLGSYGPYDPTRPAPAPPPHPLPLVSTAATTGASRHRRSRRARVVLASGLAVVIMALGGLAWALANNGTPDGGQGLGTGGSSQNTTQDTATTDGTGTEGTEGPDEGNATDGGGPAGGSSTGNGSTGDGGTDSGGTDSGTGNGGTNGSGTGNGGPGNGTGGNGGAATGGKGSGGGSTTGGGGNGSTGGNGSGGTTPPAQTVDVQVRKIRGSYTGTCPPPPTEAPSFTASITIGRTPATVRYRWVTERGASQGWQTLNFATGSGRTKEVQHTVLTFDEHGTYEDRIGVDISSPVRTRSHLVAFSVTCQQPTTPVDPPPVDPPPSSADSSPVHSPGSPGTSSPARGRH